MRKFIATFHTHLSALTTHRTLTEMGVEARMMPVPRKLSASCGTCVRYSASQPCLESMDEDVEGVYEEVNQGAFTKLMDN